MALCIMPGVGITFDDWVLEAIEEPLGYGDERSKRVNNLCRAGLAAEEVASKYKMWPDDVDEQEELVREAINEYCQGQVE